MRLAWADPHGASRAKAVTPAGLLGCAERRLQYQCRHQHARFGGRAHLRLVHARRRHGAAGNDRLAQSHHRPRSHDLSRAALGAGRRLGAVRRIFHTTARRFISRRGNFCAGSSSAWPRTGHGAHRGTRDRVVSAARGATCSSARPYRRRPGMRGRPIRTAPVEPGYFLHSETNLDAMQPVIRRWLRVRGDRICRCGRSRMNSGPARWNALLRRGPRWKQPIRRCCFAPRRGRSAAAWDISPRSCAAPRSRAIIPAAGTCTSRWSSRANGRNLFMPERGRNHLSPLGPAFLARLMQYAAP